MEDNSPSRGRLVSAAKIVWSISIMTAASAFGANYGWQSHGLVGALALGFVGLVFGLFLSSPSLLLQFLS